ncbi:MAG: hypothetical protein LBC61_02040, partial [Candidatus Peribacteria bacterium]|nr:hypothetical protein [Candidatus Peribacteria bacterium]
MEKIEGVVGGCSSNIRNAILPILFASVISLPNAKANEVEQTEKLTEDPTATIVTANETKINELVRTDLEV